MPAVQRCIEEEFGIEDAVEAAVDVLKGKAECVSLQK